MHYLLKLTNILLLVYLFILCTNFGCKQNTNVAERNSDNDVRNMILAKTKTSLNPEGSGRIQNEMISYSIDDKALIVSKEIGNALKVWNNSDRQQSEYYNSAMCIVEGIELNKHEWLTLGTIIKYLGPVSYIEKVNTDPIDKQGNISSNAERIFVYYQEKNIRLSICASGFLSSIVSYHSDMSYGKTPLYWPHDYSYAKILPIISGCFKSDELRDLLIEQSKEIINHKIRTEKITLTVVQDSNRRFYDLSNAPIQIHLIDGIYGELALVYFSVKGDKTVYCHTWWKQNNNAWEMISEDQAIAILHRP